MCMGGGGDGGAAERQQQEEEAVRRVFVKAKQLLKASLLVSMMTF